MQEQMADLVKKAEPELIIGQVPETQNDHSFGRGEKPRCAAHAAPCWSTKKYNGDSDFCAQGAQTRDNKREVCRFREQTHVLKTRPQSGRAPGPAGHAAGLNFGLAQPC